MGKTITTHLLNGTPQGIRIVKISNSLCRLTIIPRIDLDIINKRKELTTQALYVLIGNNESQNPLAYIGETENFADRVKNHDYNKKFWEVALVFDSRDGDLDKSGVLFLQYMAIKLATSTKQFQLSENKQQPKQPNLSEHYESDMLEFFEDVKLLSTFAGYKIFDQAEQTNKQLFFLKYKNINATGFYDENGFTVLKGSGVMQTEVPSFLWKEKRLAMIQELTIKKDDINVLTSNKTFNSPSAASDFCAGSSTNGWDVWKNDKGLTLDEVYRRKLNDNN